MAGFTEKKSVRMQEIRDLKIRAMKLKYPSQFPTYSYLASPDETEKEGPSALQPAHILAIRGNAATISSLYDLSRYRFRLNFL